MENFMVVTFEPTGVVNAMHRDSFDLSFLGKQAITRASEIMFDADSQLWDVKLPVDGVYTLTTAHASGFPTYEAGRKFEVEWLEHCALRGVEPTSEAGTIIAGSLRAISQVLA